MPPRTPVRTTRTKVAASKSEGDVSGFRERAVWPVILVLGVLLVIALAVAGYFYYQYKHTAQAADAKEIEDLAKEIGKVMLLPEGEAPTLATVTDKEKLADQAFFEKAENGDKVLIYSASGRAILYRPSQKKIIDVTTVNVNQPADASQTAPTADQAIAEDTPAIVRVSLLNGSDETGVANTVEGQLKTILPNAAVVSKDDAEKNDYEKTVIVDVTGKSTDAANQIASALGGEVGELPEGETAPSDADILIIIGKQ